MALWLLSLLIALPYAMHMALKEIPGLCGKFCTEEWPNDASKRAYTCFVLIAQFVIPFSIMAVCYHLVSLASSRDSKRFIEGFLLPPSSSAFATP